MRKVISKLLIVLGPSYAMAYLTDKMVYVVPTLAAGLIVANMIGTEGAQERRVDEENEGGEDSETNSDS